MMMMAMVAEKEKGRRVGWDRIVRDRVPDLTWA